MQSSAVNVLQCGCLGSWNTAQFARKMCALITWSAAGIAMKPFAVIAVGFVVGKIEVIYILYVLLFYTMYPRRLHTLSEHKRMSFTQYRINGHATSGMPLYCDFIAVISSAEMSLNGKSSK